jgi:methyl-accepting chemotaxis protein
MDCPVLSTCAFFTDRLRSMPTTAAVLKQRYCRSDHEHCARWMVREQLGGDAVPGDLFPHELQRVPAVLRGE